MAFNQFTDILLRSTNGKIRLSMVPPAALKIVNERIHGKLKYWQMDMWTLLLAFFFYSLLFFFVWHWLAVLVAPWPRPADDGPRYLISNYL